MSALAPSCEGSTGRGKSGLKHTTRENLTPAAAVWMFSTVTTFLPPSNKQKLPIRPPDEGKNALKICTYAPLFYYACLLGFLLVFFSLKPGGTSHVSLRRNKLNHKRVTATTAAQPTNTSCDSKSARQERNSFCFFAKPGIIAAQQSQGSQISSTKLALLDCCCFFCFLHF